MESVETVRKKLHITVEVYATNSVIDDEDRDIIIPFEQVTKGIYAIEDDVVDGCVITTYIDGFNNTSDFFLSGGKVISVAVIDDINMKDGEK